MKAFLFITEAHGVDDYEFVVIANRQYEATAEALVHYPVSYCTGYTEIWQARLLHLETFGE